MQKMIKMPFFANGIFIFGLSLKISFNKLPLVAQQMVG
jgi:hypothetical protein